MLGFYCHHSEADWQQAILWGFREVLPVLGSTLASWFPGGGSGMTDSFWTRPRESILAECHAQDNTLVASQAECNPSLVEVMAWDFLPPTCPKDEETPQDSFGNCRVEGGKSLRQFLTCRRGLCSSVETSWLSLGNNPWNLLLWRHADDGLRPLGPVFINKTSPSPHLQKLAFRGINTWVFEVRPRRWAGPRVSGIHIFGAMEPIGSMAVDLWILIVATSIPYVSRPKTLITWRIW